MRHEIKSDENDFLSWSIISSLLDTGFWLGCYSDVWLDVRSPPRQFTCHYGTHTQLYAKMSKNGQKTWCVKGKPEKSSNIFV